MPMDQYQAVDGRKAALQLIPVDCITVENATGMALCLQRIKAEGGMSKYCAALEVEEPSTFTEALDLAMGNDGGGWCSPDRIRFGAPSEQAVP